MPSSLGPAYHITIPCHGDRTEVKMLHASGYGNGRKGEKLADSRCEQPLR